MCFALYQPGWETGSKLHQYQEQRHCRNTFMKEMQDQKMYLNDKPFPDNETGKEPFVKCSDDASSAEAYCPKRYKAMQAWRDK